LTAKNLGASCPPAAFSCYDASAWQALEDSCPRKRSN